MLDRLSKLFLYLQGKGYGSASIKSEVKSTKNFVKGGVFIDVGANKGFYSQELLSQYASRHNIERIDLLKIDVEGHELDVLKGAKINPQGGRIKCIQFEFGRCNIDTRVFFQDFWYLLNGKYGCQNYRITPLGIKNIKKYTELDEIFLTTNFLAVKI